MHALCMQSTKQQRQGAEAKQRREGDRPDRPKRTKEESPKPERRQKGLGANPGLETSQNSQNPYFLWGILEVEIENFKRD